MHLFRFVSHVYKKQTIMEKLKFLINKMSVYRFMTYYANGKLML